jgi:hypothetical protein
MALVIIEKCPATPELISPEKNRISVSARISVRLRDAPVSDPAEDPPAMPGRSAADARLDLEVLYFSYVVVACLDWLAWSCPSASRTS